MKISHAISQDGTPSTLLNGKTRDQADFMGGLNTLYELHLPLLGVELLENNP